MSEVNRKTAWKRKKNNIQERVVSCAACGEEFKTYHWQKKTCSPECAKENRLNVKRLQKANNKSAYRAYRRANDRGRRQAVHKGGDPELYQFFMEEIYNLRRERSDATGIEWEVDHIVPIHHDKVCGLHCINNLQLITKEENRAKGNNYEVL